MVEVAQNSLKKQSTRAAGLQSWYETTAKEAKAKEEAEAEAKRKKEEEEARKRAEAEAKEKEYQEQVAKRKAEFAEKQKKAREEEVCQPGSYLSSHRVSVEIQSHSSSSAGILSAADSCSSCSRYNGVFAVATIDEWWTFMPSVVDVAVCRQTNFWKSQL